MNTYLPSNWGARFLEEAQERICDLGEFTEGRITYIEGFRFVASPPIDQYGVKRQVMDIVLGR